MIIMEIFRYKLNFFIKKIIFFLFFLFPCIIGISVGLFYLYAWLFPPLDDRLFAAVNKKCATERPCAIHLHEITSFKWDRAYFFPSDHYYSNQDIKKITGISFDLQKHKTVNDQEYKTLAMFINHGKLVKYSFFDPYYEPDYLDSPSKSQYFDMLFSVNLHSDLFQSEYYFRNSIKFKKSFEIDYYEITPTNDLLYIIFRSYGSYYPGYSYQALALCSNLNQVHLR